MGIAPGFLYLYQVYHPHLQAAAELLRTITHAQLSLHPKVVVRDSVDALELHDKSGARLFPLCTMMRAKSSP